MESNASGDSPSSSSQGNPRNFLQLMPMKERKLLHLLAFEA
jgi:hypothetical protein